MGLKDIESLTVEDIKPITISFKKNEDELLLYKWILGHSGYSGFVKDTLRAAKDGETINNPNKKERDTKEDKLIDMDF